MFKPPPHTHTLPPHAPQVFGIGDRCLNILLTYDIKNYYLLSVITFIFEILRRITIFTERHSVSPRWCKVTSLLKFRVLMFYVNCELSHLMSKTEFTSTIKIKQTLTHRLEIVFTPYWLQLCQSCSDVCNP